MQSPKFPQPVNFNFLFHMYARQPNGESARHCLHMSVYTLKKMSFGGIHDHVGQVGILIVRYNYTIILINYRNYIL